MTTLCHWSNLMQQHFEEIKWKSRSGPAETIQPHLQEGRDLVKGRSDRSPYWAQNQLKLAYSTAHKDWEAKTLMKFWADRHCVIQIHGMAYQLPHTTLLWDKQLCISLASSTWTACSDGQKLLSPQVQLLIQRPRSVSVKQWWHCSLIYSSSFTSGPEYHSNFA